MQPIKPDNVYGDRRTSHDMSIGIVIISDIQKPKGSINHRSSLDKQAVHTNI